ncbi:hypothetical protein [Actinokineospora enzanensis]|uniref:hypothetical protein n=1 Tax=Actinokineospora enzanensis TaxID=155975 RepID=UPI00035F78D7|nr:hypothetical protein [Actinokineospora enzanensis]
MTRRRWVWGLGYVCGVVGASGYRRWRRKALANKAWRPFQGDPEKWTEVDHLEHSRYENWTAFAASVRRALGIVVAKTTHGLYRPEHAADLDAHWYRRHNWGTKWSDAGKAAARAAGVALSKLTHGVYRPEDLDTPTNGNVNADDH